MKRFTLSYFIFLTVLWAQIPQGYYDAAAGSQGETLQAILHDIIDDHAEQSYSSLHSHYQSTDMRPDGTVWDMYSDIPDATPPYTYNFVSSDQCGNYAGEGDCYNREHSWPKSWFNDQYPMYSDLFHVVPTDGYVNGQRGNLPYGEVAGAGWTSQNGSKVGACTTEGYSGTVFEPIDAYKGDFARIYFYMSTRYYGEDGNWSGSPMVDGAQLLPWALTMMMDWHAQDPVSQKEIDRNHAVYLIQGNRNPFVDHPEYADMIWGAGSPIPVSPSDLLVSDISETTALLSWTDNADNETGYRIYMDGTLLTELGSNTTSLSLQDLLPAHTYTVAVSCFNDFGESTLTAETFATQGGGAVVTHFFEDFETGSGSSYIDGDFSLSSGIWSAYQAGNFSLGIPYSGSTCIALNDDKAGAHITTPAVNSLGTISFYYYQRNGDAGDEFVLQYSVAGGSYETLTTQAYAVGETYTYFEYALNDTAQAIRVRIVNDNQAGHLIIDDLRVTAYDPVTIKEAELQRPEAMLMINAYPNPFNPNIMLHVLAQENGAPLTVQIYDLQGGLVKTLSTTESPLTDLQLVWNGTADNGSMVTAGVYLVRASQAHRSTLARITLLK